MILCYSMLLDHIYSTVELSTGYIRWLTLIIRLRFSLQPDDSVGITHPRIMS